MEKRKQVERYGCRDDVSLCFAPFASLFLLLRRVLPMRSRKNIYTFSAYKLTTS